MKALVPLSDGPLTEFIQGLAEYGNQDIQVSLAQQILYGLGIATAENIAPIKEGESLPDYIERLDSTDLATIEGLGIGQGQQLQEYFRIATRLILYQQYVTGRWIDYAKELDVDKWSPYVSHLLDDCLRISSESEGRRWAIAIEVIAKLYRPDARERFGLVYIGDSVVEHETGETVDVTEGLPETAEKAVRDQFNRYSREAGVRLRDLFREVDSLPPDDSQAQVQEIRRILNLATDSTLDDKQVNRQATGGKSLMPAWVLPEDTPPAWAAFLANQFPDAVSGTGSLGMGQRYVQVRWIKWPKCPICQKEKDSVGIFSEGPICVTCGTMRMDGRLHFSTWATRVADEHGRYPPEWTEGPKPAEWVEGIAPEYMDIHGLKVSVWEVAVKLEELDG
jgi:hypothetical protein